MSKSPRLRGPKLHEECYTQGPKHAHSFLNHKNNFDIKLLLNYCALRGIKPPLEEIKDFDELHSKAKQTVINININILSEKKALEAGRKRPTKGLKSPRKSEKSDDDAKSVASTKSEEKKIVKKPLKPAKK